MGVKAIKNGNSFKKKWMFCLILTGSIFTFLTWTIVCMQSSDFDHGFIKCISHLYSKENTKTDKFNKLFGRKTDYSYLKNRTDRLELAIVKFQQKESNESEILDIKTKGYPTLQNKIVRNPKVLTKNNESLFTNVFDVSRPGLENPNLCIKTKTPKRFIICTHSKIEDKIISGSLQRHGVWEGSITKRIYRVLNQEKPITFIDIGANIGYFSLLAAAAGQTVISVEPWRRHVHKFTSSIHLNKFQNNITVINNAVSNERREVKIDITRQGNMGGARLVSDGENVDIKESISINSILLNDIVAFIHTPNVVLKLDIEGHECRALERSEDVFNNFNVLLITMEWRVMQRLRLHPGSACQEKNIQKMADMLTMHGYKPFSDKYDIGLDPKYHKRWTDVDIYWKLKREKNLTFNT